MAKLSGIETLWASVPFGAGRGGSGATEVDLVRVEVTSDDGAIGTGFTYTLTGGADLLQAALDGVVKDTVLGADLDWWPQAWERVWQRTHRLGRGVVLPALSAVDIAVWDLRARLADLPLYRYLGAHAERVPVYGSGRSTNQMGIDELIDGQRRYVAEGYDAVKLRVGMRRAEEDIERIAAVRQALGDDVRVMVDCNERLDMPTALWLGHKLDELGVYWMEEPLVADDVGGHAQLAARCGVPIAVGEHLQGRFEFGNYLRAGAASILQPDVPLTGGVTEWLRVAAAAEVHGAVLAPHFLPELHVHLAAAVPNCRYVEHFPLIDDVLEEILQVKEGHVSPPDRAGHGMRWDTAALDRFRHR